MQKAHFVTTVFVLLFAALQSAHGRQRHLRGEVLKSASETHCQNWTRVAENRFPFVCSIHSGKTKKRKCSGTLIRPKWVLTSAHCLDAEPSSFKRTPPLVLCGMDVNGTKNMKGAFVAKAVHLHDHWTGKTEDGYDVALLKLDRAANLTLPKMHTRGWRSRAREVLIAIDWKMDSAGKDFYGGMKISPEMQVLKHSDCKKHHGHARKGRSICAELQDRKSPSCHFGAPLLIADAPDGNISEGSPRRDRLVGIPSINTDESNATTLPGLYTSVEFFLSWITNLTDAELKEPSSKHKGEDKTPESAKDDTVRGPKTARLPEKDPGVKKASNKDLLQKMINAIRSDNGVEAEAILSDGLDIDTTYHNTRLRDYPLVKNSTLLHWAACFDATKCAKVFLEHEATLEWTNAKKLTPLHAAVLCGSRPAVKVFLSAGAKVDAIDFNRWTSLHMASFKGDLPIVKHLVIFGANVHATTRFGLLPLHQASFGGHPNVVEFLIAYGAVVDVIDDTGSTPLHFASSEGHVGVVKVLLSHEADVHKLDINKRSALHEAAGEGHFDVMKALIAHDADIDATDQLLWSSLHFAADGGHLQSVKILISHGADIDAATSYGWTPLHLAASKGHVSVVQALSDAGASKSITNRDGLMPLHVICDSFAADCTYEMQAALVSLLSP